MTKNKRLLKLSKLWINPFLIGSLVGLGYNITSKILINKQVQNKSILSSKDYENIIINKIEKEFLNINKENLGGEIKIESTLKEKKIYAPFSNNQDKYKQTLIKKNINSSLGNLENHGNKDSSKESSNETAESNILSLEARDFFKRHDIKELFKSLPRE